MEDNNNVNNNNTKTALFISSCVIGILLIAFGLQVYMDTRPKLLTSDEIKITEESGNKENEKILTVNVDDDRVVFYSFDGGKNYQTENTYSISENKEIQIVLKDNERRKVGSKKYKVKVYEDEGPTITIKDFPNQIYVGDSIDLNKYAEALDSNKISCSVTVEPMTIDTSIPGTYKITYTATDSNGLTSLVTTELKIIEYSKNNYQPSKPSKLTYYRYRTKTTSSYDCNYYECDYIDENDFKDPIYVFGKESYCCTGDDCTKRNPNIDSYELCIYRYKEDGNCIPKGEQFVPRYGISGNICYDKTLVYDEAKAEDDKCVKRGSTIFCPMVPIGLKQECGEGQISVDGYCHYVDSHATLTCPDGYTKGSDKCYKLVKKTCSKTCNTEVWSPWSNWSTTKVIANSYTEVETKTE